MVTLQGFCDRWGVILRETGDVWTLREFIVGDMLVRWAFLGATARIKDHLH